MNSLCSRLGLYIYIFIYIYIFTISNSEIYYLSNCSFCYVEVYSHCSIIRKRCTTFKVLSPTSTLNFSCKVLTTDVFVSLSIIFHLFEANFPAAKKSFFLVVIKNNFAPLRHKIHSSIVHFYHTTTTSPRDYSLNVYICFCL